MNPLAEINGFTRELFKPREHLSIPEWAEKNLTLSARVTNIPGAYSTNLTPYVREPLEAFGDDSIRRVFWYGSADKQNHNHPRWPSIQNRRAALPCLVGDALGAFGQIIHRN